MQLVQYMELNHLLTYVECDQNFYVYSKPNKLIHTKQMESLELAVIQQVSIF